MDNFKKATIKDYTAWELNTVCVRIRNKQKIKQIFKRKARRKNRQELKNRD